MVPFVHDKLAVPSHSVSSSLRNRPNDPYDLFQPHTVSGLVFSVATFWRIHLHGPRIVSGPNKLTNTRRGGGNSWETSKTIANRAIEQTSPSNGSCCSSCFSPSLFSFFFYNSYAVLLFGFMSFYYYVLVFLPHLLLLFFLSFFSSIPLLICIPECLVAQFHLHLLPFGRLSVLVVEVLGFIAERECENPCCMPP